jgi:hypothetical protein
MHFTPQELSHITGVGDLRRADEFGLIDFFGTFSLIKSTIPQTHQARQKFIRIRIARPSPIE